MNILIFLLIIILIFFYFCEKNVNFVVLNNNIKQKNTITSKIDNTGIKIFGKSSINNKNFNYPSLNIKSINSSTKNIKNLFPQSVKNSISLTQSNIIT